MTANEAHNTFIEALLTVLQTVMTEGQCLFFGLLFTDRLGKVNKCGESWNDYWEPQTLQTTPTMFTGLVPRGDGSNQSVKRLNRGGSVLVTESCLMSV